MNYEVLMLLHLNIDIGSYDCVLVDLFKIIFDRSMSFVMALLNEQEEGCKYICRRVVLDILHKGLRNRVFQNTRRYTKRKVISIQMKLNILGQRQPA